MCVKILAGLYVDSPGFSPVAMHVQSNTEIAAHTQINSLNLKIL